MNNAVECAIARMWEGYSEPLSLADIAKSAILSRFHFSRVFREATGISPGRFLSAIRIYEAKRMLVSTPLSVTEISLAVGYNSLGSFTNRFTESVGVSPTRFWRIWRGGLRDVREQPAGSSALHGTVAGLVEMPPGYATARVYLGAFRTPIIQCQPLSCATIEAEPGAATPFRLELVPPGEWFVRAVAVADSAEPEPWGRRTLLVGGRNPVTVIAGARSQIDVALRPRRSTDLPILYAVPDLEPGDITCAAEPALPAAAFAARASSRRAS
jgi:AraC family transcriptional regulator